VDVQRIILQQVPPLPGIRGCVGNGIGVGTGQFARTEAGNGQGLSQISFGLDATVWAVDSGNHRVHHFEQGGELIKTIGTGTAGDGPGELNEPIGVAVSRLGNSVFISEYGNNRISEFNQSDGAFVRACTPAPQHDELYCICLSPDETTLAVACRGASCVRLISLNGCNTDPWDPSISSTGDLTHGVIDCCFTPDGQQIVVVTEGVCLLLVVDLEGALVRQIPLGFEPRGVAVDPIGNIITAIEGDGPDCDTTPGGCVKVFSSEGTLLSDRLGRLWLAAPAYGGGLAIDPLTGQIAVGDAYIGIVHLLP
jgi:DNA-binding beta-propeller fold protein YncE